MGNLSLSSASSRAAVNPMMMMRGIHVVRGFAGVR